jgi:1-acyl-sn-glycerol-3-phosphate acyltransferase
MQEIFYRCLKVYCQAALWFYFRQWRVKFLHPVPDGPVLFVANHPNSFLDAVLVACSTHRHLWFLARANVFTKAWARTLLTWLKMSPVYRFRDGFGTLRKNEAIIEKCVKLLVGGNALLIFAEGNHNPHHTLLPLQKGFARIALEAEEKTHFKTQVTIVPVGLYYESHTAFRSRVLVQFGTPISVNRIIESVPVDQRTERLVTETTNGLKPLMLIIPSGGYEERLQHLLQNREIKKDMADQLQADQERLLSVGEKILPNTSKQTYTSGQWVNPLILYYRINHLLPKILINIIIHRLVRDPMFIGSMKFSIGMVAVPVFYFVQTAAVHALTSSWMIAGLYFISLPLSVLAKRY